MAVRHTNFHRAAPNVVDPKERWQDQGTCSAPDFVPIRDLWFAVDRDKEAVRQAQLFCQACPVQARCADWALTNREWYGIWGGLTERQRRTILRQRKRRAAEAKEKQQPEPAPRPAKRQAAECGTRGGYQRHLRLKEPIDNACRQANADADNRLRRTGTSKAAA